MKKRVIKLGAMGLVLLVALTGCGNQIPDMTDEQARMIGEYAAVTLLKYDANHRSRLVDASVLEEAAQKEALEQAMPEPTPEPTPTPEVVETPVVELEEAVAEEEIVENTVPSMEAFFEMPEGMMLTYQGMSICATYPDDGTTGDFFTLDAAPGKQLLVLNFTVNNQSGAEQRVEMFSKNTIYNVTVNTEYSENALTTMLANDMVTYMDTIPAGENRNIVLLVEIDANLANQITTISLNMKNDAKLYTIQLL